MIEIEIDGQTLEVDEGTTIIEAADSVGIYIPRFCYHCKLSIAANCRMCLVGVEKSRKPLPACATPVTAGMKVYTRSPEALKAQRAVMEFLLINHPLDCPICDQGGECELQDLSMGFGAAGSEYHQAKRSVASENLGPLIETWMTRCIHCTRCVRFGEEIAGLREMGMTFRGEASEIGTYLPHFLKSELSGNIIDLCPVGALTNKPARYAGRAWEYHEHPTIAPHDGVGSNLFVHTRNNAETAPHSPVMRAVPRACEAINEMWISDRDRYSVHGLYRDRLQQPMMKVNDEWKVVTWQEALQEAATITRALYDKRPNINDRLAALASPNSTLEELYLLQRFLFYCRCENVDYRLREHDFADQEQFSETIGLNRSLAEIEKLETILLVGSNLRCEQPLLAHRVNKAVAEGAQVIAINAADYRFAFPVNEKIIVSPPKWIDELAKIAKVLADEAGETVPQLANVVVSETAKSVACELKKNSAIFIGEQAMQHHQASVLRTLARLISSFSGATVGLLPHGANAFGAWRVGAIPHRNSYGQERECRRGFSAKQLLTTNPVDFYYLLNVEPEFDCAYPKQAIETLKKAKNVVCLTPYVTETMKNYATILLPIANFTETSGTFINMEGKWQTFRAATVPEGDVRPGWKVIHSLARFTDHGETAFEDIQQVRDKIKDNICRLKELEYSEYNWQLPTIDNKISGLQTWPMYRMDALVRRSEPLQELVSDAEKSLALSPKTAAQYGFKAGDRITAVQGDSRLTLPLFVDEKLADNTILLPAGFMETANFDNNGWVIEIQRGQV